MKRFRPTLKLLLAAAYALVAIGVGGGHGFLHDHDGHRHGQVARVECRHHHGQAHHDPTDTAAHGHGDHPASDHSCPAGEHDHSDCVVCQYLAQASLPVAIETPPARSEACQTVVFDAQQHPAAEPLRLHSPRGPPAAV